MGEDKEAIIVECPECSKHFRLWVPVKLLDEWEDGKDIGCINCRKGLRLEKRDGEFSVSPLAEEPAEDATTHTGHAETEGCALFIDDDKLIRKIGEDALKEVGVGVLVAQNSTEAMDILKANPVNLIVVDLHLRNPENPLATMDGEEFLKKAVEAGNSIPSIIMTGKELIDDIIMDPKWFELNVKGFVQKGNPFWMDELKTKVKEFLCKD